MPNKIFYILFLCLISNAFFSQEKESRWQKLKDTKVNIYKSGPYIGVQRGQYTNFEIGFERQWKKVKWVKPQTHSLHAGISYNYINNVIGYEFGYYNKTGRADFTYGVSGIYLTDFIHSRVGIVPVIGYKLYGFHLQAGFNLLTPLANFKTVNTPFLSLRFFIMKKRNVDFVN